MIQKLDHQLNWIINNEASYSKEEVKAAHEELKRRQTGPQEWMDSGTILKNNGRNLKPFWE